MIASIPNRVAANALVPLIKDEHLKGMASLASLNLAEALINKRDRGSARKLANTVISAKPEEAVVKRATGIIEKIEKIEKAEKS